MSRAGASNATEADVIVVGGGIVGLATADALLRRHPGIRLVLLEKEAEVARHQTSHNSGVVHAGIYYAPGSLKAQLCLGGVRLMREHCLANGLPFEEVGKVIVATEEAELPRLQTLLERGVANGVPGLRLLDPAELRQLEPQAAGLRAIHSPHTAITDFVAVARSLAADLARRGARLQTSAAVVDLREDDQGVTVTTPGLSVRAGHLIACAGLHADRLARLAGAPTEVRIVPFRGEYYVLHPERRDLVRGLIYPVPDPALPFLGVHFTRTVDGGVEAGPNAVLAFAREGYSATRVSASDLAGTLAFPGTWRLGRRFWRVGLYEAWRSLSKAAFTASLQRLVPAVRSTDLVRGGAGVRAQAVGPDGRLVEDFAFAQTGRTLHLLNAPSPAATASLAIGRHIGERVAGWFG